MTLYNVPSCCDVVISYENLRAVYEILKAICWAYLPDFEDIWKAYESSINIRSMGFNNET